MGSNDDDIDWAWEKAQKVRGKDPDLYRRDEAGNGLYKPSYGVLGEKSWEIDHRNPWPKAALIIAGIFAYCKRKQTATRAIANRLLPSS